MALRYGGFTRNHVFWWLRGSFGALAYNNFDNQLFWKKFLDCVNYLGILDCFSSYFWEQSQ